MEILKFKPLLKSLVWGGEKIAPYKGIETGQEHIGESWEVSAVPGSESVIDGGSLDGLTLPEAVARCGASLVGGRVLAENGGAFPLLIKFIDASADLSIQVHPDDRLAAVRHDGSRGKTEMWYVVAAESGAHLYAGLKADLSPEEYVRRVGDGSITDVLARHEVAPGDVFFLPAGRIHAICSGCFIAEIQQNSDITYRIFDYNRPGLDGRPRQLHTDLAKDAIDYRVYPGYRTAYTPRKDAEVELVSCPYFTTSLLDLTASFRRDLSALDSFLVVMCLEGEGRVRTEWGRAELRRGETLLVPADAREVEFLPGGNGMKVLTSHA